SRPRGKRAGFRGLRGSGRPCQRCQPCGRCRPLAGARPDLLKEARECVPARPVAPVPRRCSGASFPCSFGVTAPAVTAPRAEKFSVLLRLFAGACAPLFEGGGSPHLKLVAKADKRDVIAKIGVGAKRFRKDDTPVSIDAENLDVAVERDRELIPLVRIVWQAREKPVDLFRKSLA